MIKLLENIFLGFNKVAYAQPFGTGGATGGTGGATLGTGSAEIPNPLGAGSTFLTVIDSIINYLIFISAPILAIMVLVAGFQILTARGNSSQIVAGKQTLTYAVIGFIVILVSKGVALILLSLIKV